MVSPLCGSGGGARRLDAVDAQACEHLTVAVLATVTLAALVLVNQHLTVAALVHDVLITMGAIAVFDQLGLVGVKISLPIIAAFLTIIGYSLNDTIVIFDRLRENLTKKTKVSLKEAMNQSITQSLTRTFFTSVTTFLVVSCLFVFNFGERGVLEGLGFALMVGVITGTYSTIFIACPVVLMLNPGRSDPVEGKAKSAKG